MEASVSPTMLPAMSATPVNGASRNKACQNDTTHTRLCWRKLWERGAVGAIACQQSTLNMPPSPAHANNVVYVRMFEKHKHKHEHTLNGRYSIVAVEASHSAVFRMDKR